MATALENASAPKTEKYTTGVALPGERRVATPRTDLSVLRKGLRPAARALAEGQDAAALLHRLALAIRKPGIRREVVFPMSRKKALYAYYVFSGDVSKVIREDAHGNKLVGRITGGRFRPTKAKSA